MYLLADLYGNGAQVIKTAELEAQSVVQGWNQTWLDVINSDSTKGLIYHQLCQLGLLFAICTLMFWMVQFGRSLLDDDYSMRPFADLLYPLFVAMLLANNGALLANFIHLVRAEINFIDNQILAALSSGIPIKQAIIESQQYAAISDHFSALLSQCQAMIGQDQTRCLQAVQKQAQGYLDATGNNLTFVKHLAQVVWTATQNLLTGSPVQDLNRPTQDTPASATAFNLFAGAPFRFVLGTFTQASEWAFQNLMEVSLLLTCLMAPLAVGGTLLPFGTPIILGWLIGVFSIGMAKISYDILVGLTGEVILNTKPTDTMGFEVFLGLAAPFIALAVASGGGLAVWIGITSGPALLAKVGVNFATRRSF